MEDYLQVTNAIAMSMGAAWASGINLYAAVLMLGVLGHTGNILLPEGLMVLAHPLVIGSAAVMYVAEFFADKTPGVDTGWDVIHSFIRIPAGAVLAAGAVGDVNPAVAVAAGILGGAMAAGSHVAKSGTRVLINTSPEPFSNWTASLAEDVAVIGGLWAALHYPLVFLGMALLWILLLIWLLPKIGRGITTVFRKLREGFGSRFDSAKDRPGNGLSAHACRRGPGYGVAGRFPCPDGSERPAV